MTRADFLRKFPKPLLTRAELESLGIGRKALECLAVELTADRASEVLPPGKIGALPVGTGRKHLYRARDVIAACGL